MVTITGPNNAAGIVWALGESFLSLISFLFTVNAFNSNYWSLKVMEGLREGRDDDNGPKRREMRHLGH